MYIYNTELCGEFDDLSDYKDPFPFFTKPTSFHGGCVVSNAGMLLLKDKGDSSRIWSWTLQSPMICQTRFVDPNGSYLRNVHMKEIVNWKQDSASNFWY